jgi:hypothetical protein
LSACLLEISSYASRNKATFFCEFWANHVPTTENCVGEWSDYWAETLTKLRLLATIEAQQNGLEKTSDSLSINEASGSPCMANRTSIKRPISVPVSPSSAVKCYPCRKVPLNYNKAFLFHGGDTGSTPERDASNNRLATASRALAVLVLGHFQRHIHFAQILVKQHA